MMSFNLVSKKNIMISITLSVVLILGNILPVYSIGDHSKHGKHLAIQTSQRSNLQDKGLH